MPQRTANQQFFNTDVLSTLTEIICSLFNAHVLMLAFNKANFEIKLIPSLKTGLFVPILPLWIGEMLSSDVTNSLVPINVTF